MTFDITLEDKINAAATKLKNVYSNTNESLRKERLANRDQVLSHYKPIFSLENIRNLDFSTLNDFAQFEKNKHWKNIFRHSREVEANFDNIRKALEILVDSSLGPSDIRLLNSFNNAKGLGPAILTAILYIENPDDCAVLNGISYAALANLDLVNFGEDTNSLVNNYKRANSIILNLKEKTGLDLWTLDWVFYDYVTSLKTKNSEISEESRWFVEKTRNSTHIISTLPLSSIGELLWSPKSDKSGRQIYECMEETRPGDFIIHLVMDQDNSIMGVSKVKERYSTFTIPEGLSWTEDGYKVELEGYTALDNPLKWEDVRNRAKDILLSLWQTDKGVFYNKNLNLNQSGYITKASLKLVSVINDLYKENSGKELPYFNGRVVTQDPLANNAEEETDHSLPRNIILHGPVGTGKTYYAGLLAIALSNKEISGIKDVESLLNGDKQIISSLSGPNPNGRITNVTFHQSYGYEDFIGGIKAKTTKNNEIRYEVVPGIFKILCDDARRDLGSPFVIIIDEINRGDISRIFGELITLIEDDKRSSNKSAGISLTIPNFSEKFSVPSNVYIIGTMNDSDRSIALLDVALRRRFLFFRVQPSSDVIGKWMKNNSSTNNQEFSSTVINLFDRLNKKIHETKGEDFLIGHAFFKDLASTKDAYETLRQIFTYKIIPLLKEIYFGRDEILYEKVLKGKFFKKKGEDENTYYEPGISLKGDIEEFKTELNTFLGSTNDH